MNVYHYTTLEALKGILQPKNLCFWASRYDTMNDPTDYIYAKEKVIPVIKQLIEENKDKFTEKEREDIAIHPYILSTCELEDDINMWRFYRAEVMLELDWDLLKACHGNEYTMKKCEYVNDSNIYQKFADLFNEHEQSDNFPNIAYEVAVVIKHEAYKNENEYRIFKYDAETFCISGSPDKIHDGEIPFDVKVKCVRNGDYVLYKEFQFRKKVLKGITVKCIDERKANSIIQHIKLILLQNKYDLTKIDVKESSSYPVLY